MAQEPARQRRRRAGLSDRRRGPQPQLRRALGLRQRGVVPRSGGRDLSRSLRRLGARDAGAGGTHQPSQAGVPLEHPLVRRVAPLPAGLAGRDPRRGLPALRGARRHRQELRHPGLQPGAVGRHAVRDERRDDRLLGDERRRGRLYARAWRGPAGSGIRVPGRRGADPGGVRAAAPLPLGPGEVGAGSGGPGVSGRHRGGAVLPRRGRHRPAERADVDVRLQVRRLLRRSAGGPRARQPRRRQGHGQVPDQRRQGAKRAHA